MDVKIQFLTKTYLIIIMATLFCMKSTKVWASFQYNNVISLFDSLTNRLN